MDALYRGPLRAEPLAIELHNTVYADGGDLVDGLAEPASAHAFVEALAPWLPDDLPPGAPPTAKALIALRAAVRTALHAAVDETPHDAAALAAISQASGRAPTSPRIVPGPAGEAAWATDYHGARRADVVLASIAASAIDLVAGPHRGLVRACGAPGCVLLYLQDHPRRQWCCNACGNRARQARHYRRTHRRAPPPAGKQ